MPDMKHFYDNGVIFFKYNGATNSRLTRTTLLKKGGELFDGKIKDSSINNSDTLAVF